MQIITRKEAKEKGLSRYYTGEPCKRGHIAERRVANHCCATCSNEQSKEHQRKKRESTDLTVNGNPKHEQKARELAKHNKMPEEFYGPNHTMSQPLSLAM